MNPPIEGAYWVQAGRFLAGPHPRQNWMPGGDRLSRLLGAGVEQFVDLTTPEESGVAGYASSLASRSGASYEPHPIEDMGVPAPEALAELLDRLEAHLSAGRLVYLHCQAGRGRTGTVVGCYLVRQGLPGNRALERVERLRREGGLTGRSPETEEQRQLVRNWAALDPRRPVGD